MASSEDAKLLRLKDALLKIQISKWQNQKKISRVVRNQCSLKLEFLFGRYLLYVNSC